MIQNNPRIIPPLYTNNGTPSERVYRIHNESFDETNSIISLYGELYVPSQIDEPESLMISGSMLHSEILSHLNQHGCEDLTGKLDPRSISNGAVAAGGSGDIYRGALQDGRRVGIKCLRILIGMDEEGEKQVKRAARELYIWSKCKHPNIQELTGVALHDDRVAMISPWMTNGNLNWYISRNPEVDRYYLIVQTAAAVAYLRENDVVHGDIEANFLVSEDHIVKLTDFGSSVVNHCSLKFTATTSSSNITIRWTAPEIFLGETHHTYEGDVYALGMTILETITGAVPWHGILDVTVMHNLIQKRYPSRPERWMPTGYQPSNRLWNLITRCWASEPGKRPHATDVRDEARVGSRQQQHQLCRSMNSATRRTVDAQTQTEPTSSNVQESEEPASLSRETRKRRSWNLFRNKLSYPQTASQVADAPNLGGPDATGRADEKRRRKTELLQKRKLREEQARARCRELMAKQELMITDGSLSPSNWDYC